jgi:alginate O-acetyltransferase complex protein AlgI
MYVLILFLTIVVDYIAGLQIERSSHPVRRRWLIVSILTNLLILAVFKYASFIETNLDALAQLLRWNYPRFFLEIILPVGLSFHTFQAMSYTFEVYYGRQRAEQHPGIFALYVMFFPQLVAGPIERPQNLLHQFREHHTFGINRVTAGLQLMVWGMFKKVVIADRLALYVNTVFDSPSAYAGLPVLIATYFFAFQIYCDFSGYSDIAIGSAQVLGIRLMTNFRQPYFSLSVGDFWRRWHISLSTWFRDYLYIPLGGNRGTRLRTYCNLLIVFLASGLWHGASWTFVVWGAIHGSLVILFLIATHARAGLRPPESRVPVPTISHVSVPTKRTASWFVLTMRNAVAMVATFHLVAFAWIFFRASTLDAAIQLIQGIATVGSSTLRFTVPGFGNLHLGVAIISLLILVSVDIIDYRYDFRTFFASKPRWLEWLFYQCLIILTLIFGIFSHTEFIYFQF